MSEGVIGDEYGTLLRDKVRIRERWVRFFHKLLNTISLKLDPTIIKLFPPRPLELSLGDELSMDEMTEVIKGMPNWKAGGARRPPGRITKTRSPQIHPAFSPNPCQCLDDGKTPRAMEGCDHQGPSQNEGSL